MTDSDSNTGHEWYLARAGKRYGPMTDEELARLARDGNLVASDHLWRQGFEDWIKVEAIPGLLDAKPKAEPPAPAPAEPASEPEAAADEVDQSATSAAAEAAYADSPITATQFSADEPEPAPRKRRRRGGVGRKLIAIAAVLLLLVVGAAFALPYLVSAGFVRDQIAQTVKTQTGRDLDVSGRASFTVFPTVGIDLNDVTFSNPPGMAGAPLLHMARLTVDLKVLPLLGRKFEVDRFILKRPVVELRVDRDGRANWSFEKAAAWLKPGKGRAVAGRDGAGGTPKTFLFAQAAGASALQDLKLGQVQIVDGTLNYTDERTGARHQVSGMNVTLTLPDLDQPLDADGALVWRTQKVDFKARVEQPRALLSQKPTPLQMSVSSEPVKGSFVGKALVTQAVQVSGEAKAETPSVRLLAAWLGSALPPSQGFGPATLTSQLDARADEMRFSGAQLNFDGMKVQGDGVLKTAGAKPHLQATLDVDKLDLNLYTGGKGAQTPPKGGKDSPITDLLKKLEKGETPPKAKTRSLAKPSGSPLAPLRGFDADVDLTLGALLVQALKIGKSTATVRIKDGQMGANLTRMSLYGGIGTGQLNLDGRRDVPAFTSKMRLAGVSAAPLLKDAVRFDKISGKARLDFVLSGTGTTEQQIVSSLQGTGNFAFADGAIKGVNIAQMMRGLQKGQLSGWSKGAALKTDFSSLTASFIVQNGVARNNDLNLVGPLVRVTGKGIVNLARKSLDYRAQPVLVANLQGQGATGGDLGLTIPVHVRGPWANPQFLPDIEGIIKNPQAVVDAVKKLSKDGGKGVQDVLKKVIGGGGTKQQGPQAPIDTGDILRRMLGQ